MAQVPLESCSAAVLAGGRGERFGGCKPLAPFRGTTLLAHLLEELRGLGFAQRLVVAKDLAPLQSSLAASGAVAGVEFARDGSERSTPLAGLVSALQEARREWVFAVAADMPFAADRALLLALLAAAPGEAAVVAVNKGIPQPLCALWNRARCVPAAEAMLASSSEEHPRGPRALLARVAARRVEWSDGRPFLDADTREDLARLESPQPEGAKGHVT